MGWQEESFYLNVAAKEGSLYVNLFLISKVAAKKEIHMQGGNITCQLITPIYMGRQQREVQDEATRQRRRKGELAFQEESKKGNSITSKVFQLSQNPTKFKKFKKIKKKGRSNQELQDSSKDYQEESKMCQEQIKKDSLPI